MTDVVFAREPYADIIQDIKVLLPSHWKELALYQDDVPLDPDYDMYRRIDEAGAMLTVTARKDGALVGYAVYFVRTHHHYKNHRWAVSDIFWLAPECRNHGHGRALFQTVEDELKKMGCDVCHTTIKVEHPAAGLLLGAMGHKLVEQGYSKKL